MYEIDDDWVEYIHNAYLEEDDEEENKNEHNAGIDLFYDDMMCDLEREGYFDNDV